MIKKSLICITTCNRFVFTKLFLPDYLAFCENNPDFDFLIALDGDEEDYQTFAKKYQVPLLYSDARHGVGISKNRVLDKFPDYGYYFFIDDDVELVNPEIFPTHIEASKETGFHHFSGGHQNYFTKVIDTKKYGDFEVLFSKNGSGAFNFFTKYGLEQVGGWHTEFAKYKRYGHTEHSYRFVNKKIQPFAFNVLTSYMEGYIKIHELPHVTDYNKQSVGTSGLGKAEEKIMEQKLDYFPINSLGNYSYNNEKPSINQLNAEIKDAASCRLFERTFDIEYLTAQECTIAVKDLYRIASEEIILLNKRIHKLEGTLESITNSKTFKLLNSIKRKISL